MKKRLVQKDHRSTDNPTVIHLRGKMETNIDLCESNVS